MNEIIETVEALLEHTHNTQAERCVILDSAETPRSFIVQSSKGDSLRNPDGALVPILIAVTIGISEGGPTYYAQNLFSDPGENSVVPVFPVTVLATR